MGRKIPGKKHRGVNDPIKQQKVRLSKIKDKINAPPVNVDDQHIPKSLQRVIDLKNKVKQGVIPSKTRRKKSTVKNLITSEHPNQKKRAVFKGRPEKAVPVFTLQKDESVRQFQHRMSRICTDVIKESMFENKYKVDVKRNLETGTVEELVKRTKNLATKKKDLLTKSQKRQKKLKERKQHREESTRFDDEPQKDFVKFGEIVHQPPSLSVPRRGTSCTAPRPGKKELLLQSIIGNNSSAVPVKKTIDKTSKRKDLPHAVRRQLERQRDEVVSAYKLLKSKRK